MAFFSMTMTGMTSAHWEYNHVKSIGPFNFRLEFEENVTGFKVEEINHCVRRTRLWIHDSFFRLSVIVCVMFIMRFITFVMLIMGFIAFIMTLFPLMFRERQVVGDVLRMEFIRFVEFIGIFSKWDKLSRTFAEVFTEF